MKIKEFFKKIIYGNKYSSATYVKYLRKKGMSIGDDVDIYVPMQTIIDEQYPWLISVGNHVRITNGVKILTHDYSWSVIKGMNGAVLGASGKVTIKDNVFIGMNSIICRNVTIGNNVIIAAGSVVTKNCDENSVYAGVPAKKIMSIDEYIKKRNNLQLKEAKELFNAYYMRYGVYPKEDVFHEYFMLFTPIEVLYKKQEFLKKAHLCDNFDLFRKYLKNHKPIYNNYNEFMEECINEK